MNALDDFAHVFSGAQSVVGEDTANHQNFALKLNLSPHLAGKFSVRGIYLARFQRAPEGSGQSAAGRGHDIVEGRRARRTGAGRNLVVFGDFRVHAEDDRVLFGRKVG